MFLMSKTQNLEDVSDVEVSELSRVMGQGVLFLAELFYIYKLSK